MRMWLQQTEKGNLLLCCKTALLVYTLYAGFCPTWVIAAAAGSGADPPHPFKLVMVPVAHIIACECVWAQITDLQLGKVLDEV